VGEKQSYPWFWMGYASALGLSSFTTFACQGLWPFFNYGRFAVIDLLMQLPFPFSSFACKSFSAIGFSNIHPKASKASSLCFQCCLFR